MMQGLGFHSPYGRQYRRDGGGFLRIIFRWTVPVSLGSGVGRVLERLLRQEFLTHRRPFVVVSQTGTWSH